MAELMQVFQDLEDLLTEVSITDMQTREEKAIYLAVKTIRNMVDGANHYLTINSKPSKDDLAKAKGIIAKCLRTISATIGRIKSIEDPSDSIQMIKHTLVSALKTQTSIIKNFE